ncbi:hypothetical protein RRG08_008022 [Elysia crispata]|uniref:Uncharacterized protein n=1 Tax=Elysia crispata TaxID=231223 RepID=A0AAE1D428_9GAST|nr:hypothetical protein RRG08_008022 [Elysia crispata]
MLTATLHSRMINPQPPVACLGGRPVLCLWPEVNVVPQIDSPRQRVRDSWRYDHTQRPDITLIRPLTRLRVSRMFPPSMLSPNVIRNLMKKIPAQTSSHGMETHHTQPTTEGRYETDIIIQGQSSLIESYLYSNTQQVTSPPGADHVTTRCNQLTAPALAIPRLPRLIHRQIFQSKYGDLCFALKLRG